MVLQKMALPQQEIENALQYYTANFTDKFMSKLYKFRGIAPFEKKSVKGKCNRIYDRFRVMDIVHINVVTNEDLENISTNNSDMFNG